MASSGIAALDRASRRRLGAMKQHEPAKLLVSQAIFVVRSVIAHEIHERQRVVRVGNGALEFAKRQPGDAPLKILHKLAIRFGALGSARV